MSNVRIMKGRRNNQKSINPLGKQAWTTACKIKWRNCYICLHFIVEEVKSRRNMVGHYYNF